MTRFYIGYASKGYVPSQERICTSALGHGVDECFMYRRDDIERMEDYARLRHILDKRRYAGWCLWKPMILLDAMRRAEEGDMILMSDSDFIFLDDLSPLFDICRQRQGIMLFGGNVAVNRYSVKRDCFVLMGLDAPEYWDGPHVWGGFNLWMRNERNIAFVREWFEYCCDERILAPFSRHSGLPEFPEYCGNNACDESVLSLLAIKHGIEAYRSPHVQTNYAKLPEYRVPGEPLGGNQIKVAGYVDGLFENSPYGTMIDDFGWDHKRPATIVEGLHIAWAYMKDGLPDSIRYGEHILRSILENDPDSVEAHCLMGMRFMLPGEPPAWPLYDPGQALHHLQAALRLQPSCLHAAYALGVLQARLQLPEKGADLHKALLNGAPAFYLALQRLGAFPPLPARLRPERLAAMAKVDAHLARLLAARHLGAGETGVAGEALDAALSLEPENPEGIFLAALLARSRDDTAQAARLLHGLLEKAPAWMMARQVIDLQTMELPILKTCRLWLGGY